jgi:ribosomal protein S18 acetylase RimI-like enzyme
VITLRPYRTDDEDAVLALWWESWHSIRPGLHHPQPLTSWRRRWVEDIVPTHTIVVAESEAAVVGFAAADLVTRELSQIFIGPDHKRRGIGGRLLAWAQEQMPSGFTLHTLVDNVDSRVFYRRHGLVEGATRTNSHNGMETIEYRWTRGHNR